jgi:hypothetical protein
VEIDAISELASLAYDPQLEPGDAFETRVTHLAAKLMSEAKRERVAVEEAAKREGRAVPIKPHISRHMRWLVRYQVRGESINAIADTDGVNRRSVGEGIQGAAKLLRLDLRAPSVGGAPKGPRAA